jgi:hypothetical protein
MGIGNNQTGFERAFSNGPPPPLATKDIKGTPVTDIYRKMTEKESEDILSNTSMDSETSISSGNRRAIISPSKRKNGGRVLRL